MTLKQLANKLAQLEFKLKTNKARQAEIEEQNKALRAQQETLKQELYARMKADDVLMLETAKAKLNVHDTDIVTVSEWDDVYKYIARTKRWFILQRRLSQKACLELLADGKKIPGTGIFTKQDIKIKLI